ncbi:MAG: 2-oxoglutarate dehydrogenase complex dihydrolipoyllysine-residue succinyltransferase, partial [Myxococcota bacterium]
QGVDLEGVSGTGPRGRVTSGDVRGSTTGPQARSPQPTSAPAGTTERRKMTPLRRTIARRLVEAQHNAAMLTTFNEVDMSRVMGLRKQYQEQFKARHGIKLGFMSFFVKAAIEALKEFPSVNAEIDGDDIVYKHFFNIGVAVSGPKGLVVPVVKNADQLSFAEVEKAIGELGSRARDNKLRPDDFQGGTFTLSNGGIFGSLMSTPILNPPQSGILGMHAIQQRPVGIDGEIVLRPMMYLALSYDHRIIDGREAVSFLVRIKQAVENPERILLEV